MRRRYGLTTEEFARGMRAIAALLRRPKPTSGAVDVEARIRRELDPRPNGCDCGGNDFTPDSNGRWLCPCGLRY